MSIGIIGAGALGSNIARVLARAGLPVTISNSRGPASMADLVTELGPIVTAGTVEQAASADIVFAAVRWTDAEAIFAKLPSWNGRIVVDGTNPVAFIDPNGPEGKDPSNPLAAYGIKAIDLGGRHSSAVFAQFVPGARVVKAFNHLDVNMLQTPETAGGKRVLFYSGDDAAAKADVARIIEAASFLPVDLGALDVGGPLAQLPFGPLSVHNFVRI